MKIKTSELTGIALDWAVATAKYPDVNKKLTPNGVLIKHPYRNNYYSSFDPSSDWSQGGPIIDENNVTIICCDDDYKTDKQGYTTNERIPVWAATLGEKHSLQECHGSQGDYWGSSYQIDENAIQGPTPLIAAMRCYVASKLGAEVDVPEELSS